MNWLKRFLYGLLMGITSIAPGISGGTIAIALGFYEKLIESIAHILSDFRKHFSFLLPFGAGAVISIAALSVILEYFFDNFPLPTSALFIGLILGTLPFIKVKLQENLPDSKPGKGHILTGLIFFVIVLIPVFLPSGFTALGSSWDTGSGPGSVLLFLLMGVIIAATLIIPGLSGTMILMSLGLYKALLYTASAFVTAVVTFNISEILILLKSVIPIGIGLVIGGFLIARLIHKLFATIPAYIYSAVFALICVTPVVMLAEINITEFNIINIALSVLTLILGLILSRKLGEHD